MPQRQMRAEQTSAVSAEASDTAAAVRALFGSPDALARAVYFAGQSMAVTALGQWITGQSPLASWMLAQVQFSTSAQRPTPEPRRVASSPGAMGVHYLTLGPSHSGHDGGPRLDRIRRESPQGGGGGLVDDAEAAAGGLPAGGHSAPQSAAGWGRGQLVHTHTGRSDQPPQRLALGRVRLRRVHLAQVEARTRGGPDVESPALRWVAASSSTPGPWGCRIARGAGRPSARACGRGEATEPEACRATASSRKARPRGLHEPARASAHR